MSGIDLIVYGILLTFTLIGTTEFVIGLRDKCPVRRLT